MSHRGLRAGVRSIEQLVGRPRLARMARLVTNEVRLDGGNEIETNGEQVVQRVARTAEHPVIFDVGTHEGEWASSLLEQPGSQPIVHCFEPSTITIARARGALGLRATIHQLALSDHVGTAKLHVVHEGAGSNSLVEFADKGRPSGRTEAVRLSTVADVAAEAGIERITLLKIDAEGHDLAVIRGAMPLLEARAIDLVQFEYNHRWIDARAFLLDAFEAFQPIGYELGKVTPRGIEKYETWHQELETFREGNYLAWLPAWSDRLDTFAWWGG